jgi:hypothetical protein
LNLGFAALWYDFSDKGKGPTQGAPLLASSAKYGLWKIYFYNERYRAFVTAKLFLLVNMVIN